jgi:hypothetical protein
MRMCRGWFQWLKWRLCLRSVRPKSIILLCVFLWAKGLYAIFINKYSLFTVERVCRVKRFGTGSETQSKDLYDADFAALIKRWDKCINIGGDYVEKCIFFPSSNITYFTSYIYLWSIYWLSLVLLKWWADYIECIGMRTIRRKTSRDKVACETWA